MGLMNNAAANLDLPYTVLDTVKAASPKRAALTFSACLAADKGYSSRLVRVRGGYDVVASDNRAIAFRSALRIVQ